MANICSTYVQIFPKERIHFGRDDFQFHKVTEELLSGTYGYSYNTPLFISFGTYGRYLELAYGEKWAPVSVQNYFEKHLDKIDAIFFRFFDSGGDYDFVSHLSNNEVLGITKEYEPSRKCLYAFDEVRFKSKQVIHSPLVEYFSSEYGRAKLHGNYLSENSYCNLSSQSASNFAEYRIDTHENAMIETDRCVNCNDPHLLNTIRANSSIVEYYYRNKLVTYSIDYLEYEMHGYTRSYINKNYNWLHFPFDSWQNCADPIYLKYIDEINPLKVN